MCCCPRPNINGTPNAYSWDGKTIGTRPIHAPTPAEGDTVLFDEPGRCGGLDAHSHHFIVVKAQYGGFFLLVMHGGGQEQIALGYRNYLIETLPRLDTTDRYWILHDLYSALREYGKAERTRERHVWQDAAREKRIKTRKGRGTNSVTVWIEAPTHGGH